MSRLFVFDVDSTLLRVESLDFAVERALKRAKDGPKRAEALKALTDQGMAGELDFRQSLERRLEIAKLTEKQVSAAAEALARETTPGMAALLKRLRGKGDVAAVSGGFTDLIEPALSDLGFAASEIRANRFVFEAGRVSDFDRTNPLSRSGGKASVVAALKQQTGRNTAVMIGDGMTDYEAFSAGAADAFIGFGGIRRRDGVASRAPAYADDVAALERLLLK